MRLKEFIVAFLCRKMSPEKFVCRFFIIIISMFVIWGGIVWIVDPYMYFHRAWLGKQVYHNSAAMIPGVLKHCDYDTVLFGTSMTQNFNISEINDLLGVKCVKATTAGMSGDTFVQYFLTALKNNSENLKRCIVGVDVFSFSKTGIKLHEPYYYLYGDSWFPVEYFFSGDTFDAVAKVLRSNAFPEKYPHRLSFDMMFSTRDREYSRRMLEKDVRKLQKLPPVAGDMTGENLRNQLFLHIKNNPQIKFDLFLPPYSIYYWCYLKDNGLLDDYIKWRNFIADEAAACPNVKLHDFQAEKTIICHFDFYKDVTHYSGKVNSMIVRSIGAGSHCYEKEEFIRNSERLVDLIEEYYSEFVALRNSR